MSEGTTKKLCPHGHVCRPARAPSCFVDSGYYYCGHCEFASINAYGAKGMYWPPSLLTELPSPAPSSLDAPKEGAE